MGLKTSKALRKAAASGVGYRTALNAAPGVHTAKLIVYSGAVPANADASIGSASALCEYKNGEAGLSLGDAADVSGQIVMSINTGEVWTGVTIGIGGSPAFFRFTEAGDVPTDTTGVYSRLQGTCGLDDTFDMTVSGDYEEGLTNTLVSFAWTMATY